ncbi:MAG: hypothetical protein JNM57_08560 [Cyclobacteriaceae bacterium]|nr:hypothetical protein [Cyclobacteriaceae bacterium]
MWDDDDEREDGDDESFDPEAHQRKLEALPIYQKADEILELTQRIVDTLEKDNPHAEIHSSMMLEDAMIIPAKIAGAEAMDDYILKMENATLIKIHARSLLTQTASLKYLELVEMQYLQLLRDELDAFRFLFKEWVKSFETGTTKEGDGWGLFVPDPD